MVKQVANKKYCSPEVSLKLFINEDVITSSVGDDNIGGIPSEWLNGTSAEGGNF